MARSKFYKQNIQNVENALNSIGVVNGAGLVFCKRRNYPKVSRILNFHGFERVGYENGKIYQHVVFGTTYTVILERE